MKFKIKGLIIVSAFLLTAPFFVLAGGNAFAAGSIVGVINMQKVVTMSNQGKAANAEVQSLAKKYNGKLISMRNNIAAIQKDLQQNSSIMSSSEKTKKTQEFETDVSNFQAEEKKVNNIISQKRYALLKGIISRAEGIVSNIAKEKGFLIVVDRPSVVYRVDSIDITQEVVNQMNK